MSPRIFMRKYIPSDRTMATRKPEVSREIGRCLPAPVNCTLLQRTLPLGALVAYPASILLPERRSAEPARAAAAGCEGLAPLQRPPHRAIPVTLGWSRGLEAHFPDAPLL